ncbi:UNVERIFIED_ORG: hypothetical protein M2328_006499 [Rhodococcus erythropolis]
MVARECLRSENACIGQRGLSIFASQWRTRLIDARALRSIEASCTDDVGGVGGRRAIGFAETGRTPAGRVSAAEMDGAPGAVGAPGARWGLN